GRIGRERSESAPRRAAADRLAGLRLSRRESAARPLRQNIRSVKASICIDPEFGRAYWLLAKIYLATGQADLADAAAAEACDIEPKNASFQLCYAQSRQLLGEYDDAVLKVRAILDRENLSPIDKAQALHQMAQLAS